MAHRTKPLTIEERLTKLEENSHEPQNYREECERMNKELKKLKRQVNILKKSL
jgi:putative NADH-flavin reductase